MLSALNAHNREVVAREMSKDNGPFYCPACRGEVMVKKGTIKIHHFAHVPPAKCLYGTGESEEYRTAKLAIYDALCSVPEVSKLMVDRYLETQQLDVSCCIRERQYLTIEIQFGQEPPEEIARRLSLYAAKKIHVLWLFPHPNELVAGARYTTNLLERYLHALYFGTIYYWRGGDGVQPVHFHPDIPGSLCREWFDENDESWHAENIERLSKFSRIPEYHEIVRITDLKPFTRQAGQFGQYALPAARLWGFNTKWF
jgi:competence protein CoiA